VRLGIFGGTFDPVHFGHLLLAESCREQAALDAVWFLPTAVPPHKRGRELTLVERRVEMLELAIAGHEAFSVSRYEAERGGVNYTADTLAHLRDEDPRRELFFLMGADMLADLPTWHEPDRVCTLATLVVVQRPGAGPVDFDRVHSVAGEEARTLLRAEAGAWKRRLDQAKEKRLGFDFRTQRHEGGNDRGALELRKLEGPPQRHRDPPPRGRRPEHPLPDPPGSGEVHRGAGALPGGTVGRGRSWCDQPAAADPGGSRAGSRRL